MSGLRTNHLFYRSSDGKILKRKEGIWSSTADKCVDCGTTERKHEALGRCRLCYLKWKRANDPDWRARKLALHKQSRLRHADRLEAFDKARKSNPRRKKQRREISRRYYDKISRWPLNSEVLHEFFPGRWIKGTIQKKTNGSALVKFATFEQWIPFRRLQKVEEGRLIA